MSTPSVTPKPASSEKKMREIKAFSIELEQDVLVVNEATIALLDKGFVMQDAYDNESKYRRSFVFDAVRAHVKAECSRIIAAWDSAISKTSKLYPKNDRDANVAHLLESKRGQQQYEMVKVAIGLKQELS